MPQKIRILPEKLCNQIAAGEVVERPASVIKELLENSLDAESLEIRIEVERGGKRLIRVMDDGTGMSQDDAFLSLERHATSKIQSESDLFRLGTLGFRGEALPSIASVSRLTLSTRSMQSEEGWEIYTEGGTVKRAGAVGIPAGTSIEVRDLFFNTPARRKFLRRDETEIGHIADVVTKLALAHPEVQFRLVHNGRPLLEVNRHGNLAERVAAILGRPLLKDLIELRQEGPEGLCLSGYLSRPDANRSGTGSIYTYINGRFIRDRVVQHALMDGYRNLLLKGRYPIVVLFLSLDPELVDVNVHPTKHEVRFRDQRLVHDFIANSVRDALRPSGWLESGRSAPMAVEPAEERDSEPLVMPLAERQEGGRGVLPVEAPTPANDQARRGVQEALENYGRKLGQAAPDAARFAGARQHGPFAMPEPQPAEQGPPGFFSSLRLIGQYRRSYLLCQDEDDLVLIDQHAAHERVGFEKLRAQYRQGNIERQALLFPAVLELEFREAALLAEFRQDLDRLGFDLEPFGGKSFALKAVPRILGDARAEQLVRDVAGELGSVGKSGLVEEALDEVLALMACHSVIRANQDLSPAQIRALFAELDQVDFNGHCPHGRPVMKRLALADVERMFKRT
ncbi:DNA mismatch repair protein MutL [Desulfuromonas versatilis]|uniref:DNA mismatch repair protein MutL n=1 Tax=Desulfuromonas versatilis TaxID=2802975 RepID=A0ABM8HT74_9BACT|nr:DNA mismatch repair endonuclease MutL [Desulfuromonas versatilis]BCR05156.1 DNA mismatch repair protein MutL [Desulfuromonas versatilis]